MGGIRSFPSVSITGLRPAFVASPSTVCVQKCLSPTCLPAPLCTPGPAPKAGASKARSPGFLQGAWPAVLLLGSARGWGSRKPCLVLFPGRKLPGAHPVATMPLRGLLRGSRRRDGARCGGAWHAWLLWVGWRGWGRLFPVMLMWGESEPHRCLAGHLSLLRAKGLAQAGHGCAWSPDVASPIWGNRTVGWSTEQTGGQINPSRDGAQEMAWRSLRAGDWLR